MRPYLEIMRSIREARKKLPDGPTYARLASRMGWESPRTASMKFHGKRGWDEGELERMCTELGITIAWLAANSSDLRVTKTLEAVKGAVAIDELPEAFRKRALEEIEKLRHLAGSL